MRYKVKEEHKDFLDDFRNQLEGEVRLLLANLDDLLTRGKKVSLQRVRKHSLLLEKLTKELRRKLREVEFEPRETESSESGNNS